MAGGDGGARLGGGRGRRWDVALSFAGAQREYVGQVAAALKARGVRCFYDEDEQVRLWGAHLAEELPRIYAQESAAVVVFISAEYAGQPWTRLERRAALARAVAEAGVYVLPARFDDSDLPGLLPDVVTVDLRRYTPAQFADLVANKLAGLAASPPGGPRARAGAAAGWPLEEVTDPFALEVHRPVQPEDPAPGLPTLPAYMPREHDAELGSVVRAAAQGHSGIAVLVGGSSTGKTRACWEALGLLRDQSEQWRLWHPIDPTRPDAALRELLAIGPRTVVWLNEAQGYLGVAHGGLGERVAAGLRELLRDPARAPVLVLATLWPLFWHTLTSRPAGAADPHAQARELLAGHEITVPAAFTAAQLQQFREAGDARLAQAAAGAQDGQVIQFLAGVPELLARYRNAPPAAQALIHAAMDARRLGHGPALPGALLEATAPAYLTRQQWDECPEDWLEQALAYTATPCKGIPGPLTRTRPQRTPRPRTTETSCEPQYKLADYLEQTGRRQRAGLLPPAAFWDTLLAAAKPEHLEELAEAARRRGLFRHCALLYKRAVNSGSGYAASSLVHLLDTIDRSSALTAAQWSAARISLTSPYPVAAALSAFRHSGASRAITTLRARNPARQVAINDTNAVAGFLDALRESGSDAAIDALLARDPAGHLQRQAIDEQRHVRTALPGTQHGELVHRKVVVVPGLVEVD